MKKTSIDYKKIEKMITAGKWRFKFDRHQFDLYNKSNRKIGFLYMNVDGLLVFQFSKLFLNENRIAFDIHFYEKMQKMMVKIFDIDIIISLSILM